MKTISKRASTRADLADMAQDLKDPKPIASREVHGPSFGFGTLGLVALFAFGAGAISSGIILPLLRSNPPDKSGEVRAEAANVARQALLLSMGPQAIFAAPMAGGEPVSSGLSVEQYMAEIDVRASQAGLSSNVLVERKTETVEISYNFTDKSLDPQQTLPAPKIKLQHPKSMVLIFASGPTPGTILLKTARVDGRDRSPGASFVDLVKLGGTPPQLGPNQILTQRGVFEIKVAGAGVGAFLDGAQIYPAAAREPGPALALPGMKPQQSQVVQELPRRLSLQTMLPATGAFRDRFVLVASNEATETCAAKAIVVDMPRDVVLEAPDLLMQPAVQIETARDGLTLTGFCTPPEPVPASDDPAPKPTSPAPAAPALLIRIVGTYSFKDGTLTMRRDVLPAPPPVPVAGTATEAKEGVASPWRNQGTTRIASPLVAGGALVSVSCRPGGGASIALSGLPEPADGQAAGISFQSGGGSTLAQMRWRPSAAGYEIDTVGRPNEANAVLDRLRAGGTLIVSGAGGRKSLAGPGRAQIDRLMANCLPSASPSAALAVPVKTTASIPAAPKPPPAKPASTKTASAKPKEVKTAQNLVPKPKPVAVPPKSPPKLTQTAPAATKPDGGEAN